MNNTFVILDDLSRNNTVIAAYVTCFISAIINMFAIYLVLTESKNELPLYKNCLVYSIIALFITKTFYGVCFIGYSLLPFPGIISYGLLRNVLPTWFMGGIWGVLLTFYLQSALAILFVRLMIVVRHESWFHFRKSTIIISTFAYQIVLIYIMCFMALKLDFTKEEMQKLIAEKYPKYMHLTEIYGVLIVSYISSQVLFQGSVVVVAILLISAHSFVRYAIYYEIKMQVNKMSNMKRKYHLKMARDFALQVLCIATAIALYPAWTIVTKFLPNDYNTTLITSIFHTIFVGASIPGTVFMMINNASQFGRIKRILRIQKTMDLSMINNMQTSVMTM